MEIKLFFFAERGRTHAALGLLSNQPLPAGDSFFFGHGAPSRVIFIRSSKHLTKIESQFKGGLV
jgi:hypothetical protein